MKSVLHGLLLLTFISCSSFNKETITREQKLNLVLGNVKAHLLESDSFLSSGLAAIRKREDIPSEERESFDKLALDSFRGDVIFVLVKEYFKNNFSSNQIDIAYKIINDEKLNKIKSLELTDLGPSTYQEYELKSKNDKHFFKTEKLIDEYKNTIKLADTGIIIATNIRDSILKLYSEVTFNEMGPKVLKEMTDKQLSQFSLQTRFMMGEALRYSYHRVPLVDLKYMLNHHKKRELRAFYEHIFNAIKYAYSQAVLEFKFVRNESFHMARN